MSGTDVLVAGAGPAGWAIAAACTQRGLQVRVCAPDPQARWHHTYGAWLDELAACDAEQSTRRRFDTVLVRTVGTDHRALPRTYCLIDNDGLRDQLTAAAAPATVTRGRATAIEVRSDHVVVHTDDGAELSARAVIDATGHPAALGRRAPARLAYQTAFGLVATFRRPPTPPGAMCLMDFDARPFDDVDPPTFLYAMDLGAGRWLVEETSLAGRPAMGVTQLRRRLERRLAARGNDLIDVVDTERVAFAMNAPLPTDGPAIAFGAAAAMVHPATGYHVATALRRAPAVADALVTALDDGRDPQGIARAGQRGVWPADALRCDALHRVGLEVLLALDTAGTQRFFDAFFSLPVERWTGYMSRTATPAEVQWTMMRLMLHLPRDVRRRVLRAAAAAGSWRDLVRAFTPAVVGR